ncbi:hypothetical protein CCHL11_07126 [Colletotrichum chlorophyti]|uniref:Uncharacterized protein n=1 Tax=Colletotrichum chlorophyti TaxID=708187 RepID=A0A1Q8S0M7_9PEZI|nr:hypothetical protein CCHL11_07126 [Colletotrichum chlorophyti]
MRDHPRRSPQGSPNLPPRRLSEELGDLMFSSDEYDDENDDYERNEDEDDTHDDGIETPASSRKSSRGADGFFSQVDELKLQRLQDTSESERTEKRYKLDFSDDDAHSRPTTAVSMPPFRRSSTCPAIPEDLLSSAADDVVKIMPHQAAFMKRMVDGWREIQRRSSLSTATSPMSPGGGRAVSPGTAASPPRPHTAPSPMYAPQMCFASFPQTVPERDEPDSPTETEAEEVFSSAVAVADRLGKVEETLAELRGFAKQQAGKVIASTSASVAEQDAKFAVVNRCIDTIEKMCEREPEPDAGVQAHRRLTDKTCVEALVQICEMFAREGGDPDAYRFGPRFLGEESEDDDVEYEGEDEDESESESEVDDDDDDDDDEGNPIDSDPTEYESGDFLGESPTLETDKTPPPLKPTRPTTPTRDSATLTKPKTPERRVDGPDTPRRRARLVREARAELEALFSEWVAPKNSFEERHSRIIYATEAYHARLADMKSAHACEFAWKGELDAFEKAMRDRGAFGPDFWTVVDLALPLAQGLLSCLLLVVYVFRLDGWLRGPQSFLSFVSVWLAGVVVAARWKEAKERETLYETMVPREAREMRKRHERELVLLRAAHDRAVQRVYLPEQESRA